MNSDLVSSGIVRTCAFLDSLNLLRAYNYPCVTEVGRINRVSWPNSELGEESEFAFGSLQHYLSILQSGRFTCLLFDNSIIRASYDCSGSEIVAHSLLYWPCPLDFHSSPEDLHEVCLGFEMFLHSPTSLTGVCDLTMRTPMRFDFDPEREAEDHPLVHLHTQFSHVRMFAQQAMYFPSFIKKIARTFYPEKWKDCKDLELLHEQEVDHDESQFVPNEHAFQIVWT